MIIKCICHFPMQDLLYGKGNRVANYATKSGKARCTVCKTLIDVGKETKDSGSKKGKSSNSSK